MLVGGAVLLTLVWGVVMALSLGTGLRLPGLLLGLMIWVVVAGPLSIAGRYRLEAARIIEARYAHLAYELLAMAGGLFVLGILWLSVAGLTTRAWVLGFVLLTIVVLPLGYAGMHVLRAERWRSGRRPHR